MPPGKRAAGADCPRPPAGRPTADRSLLESPLKHVNAAIQQRRAAEIAREQLVLSSVEDFRRHVVANETNQSPSPDIDVVVTGTLIWTSSHLYGDRAFVRLHLTDASPTESLEEIAEFQELYSEGAENQALVDSALLMATVFGEYPNLPPNGSVVRITKSRRRLVYEGKRCQLIARAADISIVTEAP